MILKPLDGNQGTGKYLFQEDRLLLAGSLARA
jgi:hypothetical protein